jgi:peptidoglycan/xylan/chitin deacetylase (PgdA/CDA1 family)
MYHHLESGYTSGYPFALPVEIFERHLNDLQRWGYNTITFHELFEALDGKGSLPPKPVIISFDDAYSSVSKFAIPLLKARGQRCSIFVVVDLIGGFNDWESQEEIPQLEVMDERMLLDAVSVGMELGSHTCRHANLLKICPEQLEEEILRSRRNLESKFGQVIETFCYPYGVFSYQMQPILENAGYRGAISIFSDSPSVTAERFRMRRVYMHAGDNSWRFRLKLSRPWLAYVAHRDRNWRA